MMIDKDRTEMENEMAAQDSKGDPTIAPKAIISDFENHALVFHDMGANTELIIHKGEILDFDDNINDILNAITYKRTKKLPPKLPQIGSVIRYIGKDNKKHTHLRTAAFHDALYYQIDMENEIRIDKDGWNSQLHDNSKFIFRPTDFGASQVYPIDSSQNLYELLEHLPLTHNSRILLVGAIVAALFKFPHTIINIVSDYGAGKTTIMLYIQDVIDPVKSKNAVLAPTNEKDLKLGLSKGIVYLFDNKTELTSSQSDIFAQAATNAKFELRALYKSTKMLSVDISTTVIIGSIKDVMINPDILDRTIKIELEPLTERKGSDVLYIRDTIMGETLGATFDIISYIYRRERVEEDAKIRMSEYYWITVAAAEFCGISRDEVDAAFAENDKNVAIQGTEMSFAGRWILETIKPGNPWVGNATKMMGALSTHAIMINEKNPYTGAIGLGTKLKSIKKSVEKLGYIWTVMKETKIHTIIAPPKEKD